MFVRCKKRFKDGKEYRYWSVVENVRVRGGRVVQRHVLYLGEINDSQHAAWCRSIEVVEGKSRSRQMALFPEDREAPALNCEVVRINIAEVALHEPRQWGACWLALSLWDRLDLDRFWGPRAPPDPLPLLWRAVDAALLRESHRALPITPEFPRRPASDRPARAPRSSPPRSPP